MIAPLVLGILLIAFSGPLSRLGARGDDRTPSGLEGPLNRERAERIAEARRDNVPQALWIRFVLVVGGLAAIVAGIQGFLD